MKIAQIVCSFPPYPGGIGQSAYRFGEILSREHELSSYTLLEHNSSKQKPLTKEPTNQKVVFLDPLLRSGHGAFAPFLLLRLLKFDCIYLHYPFFGIDFLILLLSRLKKKQKLVIHYHMDTPSLPKLKRLLSFPSRIIFSKLMKRADKIIVSSLDYAKQGRLSKLSNLDKSKIVEIPFGLETDIFKPRIRSGGNALSNKAVNLVNYINRQVIKRGAHSLLFVGGLDRAHYFKGLKILLAAIKELQSSVNLRIIGSGDLQADYEEEARILGVSKKIKFLGRLDQLDLIREYQNADMLLLPSINKHEAFGLVLIEAMACGTPVIASNLPGVRSVFRDKEEGLFVRAGDIYDLRDKIDYLCQNEELRMKMSESARKLVEKKYAWEKVADLILDEFSKL